VQEKFGWKSHVRQSPGNDQLELEDRGQIVVLVEGRIPDHLKVRLDFDGGCQLHFNNLTGVQEILRRQIPSRLAIAAPGRPRPAF